MMMVKLICCCRMSRMWLKMTVMTPWIPPDPPMFGPRLPGVGWCEQINVVVGVLVSRRQPISVSVITHQRCCYVVLPSLYHSYIDIPPCWMPVVGTCESVVPCVQEGLATNNTMTFVNRSIESFMCSYCRIFVHLLWISVDQIICQKVEICLPSLFLLIVLRK